MVLVLAVVAVVAAIVWYFDLTNPLPVPHSAAPASDLDPQAPERAEPCMVLGCPQPWTVARHGWRTCDGHDHRPPFDQELDTAVVGDEAEQYLRRVS